MPLYDRNGVEVVSDTELKGIGTVLLDAPLPMRWTHPLMERLHAAMLPPPVAAPAVPAPPAEPEPAA